MQYLRRQPLRGAPRRAALLGLSALVGGIGLACEGDAPINSLMPPAGDPSQPAVLPELPQPHACGAQLSELAIYQAVKTPLLQQGGQVARNAPIIEGRRAYVRAFFTLGGTPGGNVRARLWLNSAAGNAAFDATALISQDSTDPNDTTTLNFDLPGANIRPDTQAVLELELGASCPSEGKSTHGPISLDARYTGVIKLTLVPVRYDADGSGRMPDISEAQVKRYKDALMGIYPTQDVEIQVRPAVSSPIALTGAAGWSSLLDSIRMLRASDRVASDVYYYAVVSPAASFATYCRGACTAGLSFLVPDNVNASNRQVGAGVGWEGTIAADTLIHEIGHQHGRPHSPCGGGDGPDKNYPYAQGQIGVWGLDIARMGFKNPTTVKDFMGYCSPQWISDYTFSLLADRRTSVNTWSRELVVDAEGQQPNAGAGKYRTLLVEGDGSTLWGGTLPGHLRPAGVAERAQVLDAAGATITEVTVYRSDYGHGKGASLDVPVARPGWASIVVAGHSPVQYSRGRTVPALQEIERFLR